MLQHSFMFLIIVLSLSAGAQVWEKAESSSTPPPEFVMRAFKESDFQTYPWMNEFTNVIVINKSNEGRERQTLRLFVNGKLQFISKVSTGREKFEEGCKPGQDPKADHCSGRAYWSTTPTGYFDVKALDERYFSKLWKTWMPFAVFFEAGIATHQAPAGTEGKLGSRASGGCVRMHPNDAPVIFKTVSNTPQGLIPVIGRDGELKKTPAGDVIRKVGNKTLYIVQNVVIKQ
ncbi:MAG: L,D-transpeptidase [Bdellovibrionaceae bacterium]|nr:L,D-transpeptidase [Bdellovibrio sp.]